MCWHSLTLGLKRTRNPTIMSLLCNEISLDMSLITQRWELDGWQYIMSTLLLLLIVAAICSSQ